MKLNTNSGDKPLWSQVYDILKERILTSEYRLGTKLPSEQEFTIEFNVSRITIRQAINKLQDEGYVIRKRGKGTIVQDINGGVSTYFQSSFQIITELNHTKNRSILRIEWVQPTKEIANFFGIKNETNVLLVSRCSKIDNRIIAIYDSYLNPLVNLTPETDFSNSLHTELSKSGFKIDKITEYISSTISSKEVKKRFEIDKDVAVISRKRLGFSNKIPIEYTESMYIGNGYTIIVNHS